MGCYKMVTMRLTLQSPHPQFCLISSRPPYSEYYKNFGNKRAAESSKQMGFCWRVRR